MKMMVPLSHLPFLYPPRSVKSSTTDPRPTYTCIHPSLRLEHIWNIDFRWALIVQATTNHMSGKVKWTIAWVVQMWTLPQNVTGGREPVL